MKGDPAGDHFVHDDSEGVDVRAGVHLLEIDLLGRHVLRRSEHDSRSGHAVGVHEPGQPEVHDPDIALPVDHDVLGLEVAVDDAQPVGLGQAFGDLDGDADGLGRVAIWPDAADEILEVLALDVFHGDEVGQAEFSQVV